MTTESERLAEADACHDEDPPRSAALLRGIDPVALAAGDAATYAFLVNHVLGEKLGFWDEALTCQRRVLERPAPAPVLWRQFGAAACAAGEADELRRAALAVASGNRVDLNRAYNALQLGAAMYEVPTRPAAEAAARTLEVMAPFRETAHASASLLDGPVAACLNNLASGLQDRPLQDLRHDALRTTAAQCAELAQHFWRRAGNWVNLERALYLRAMISNALGDLHDARNFALEALAVLDSNDTDHTEDVDRAFIELERAHACKQLGLVEEAEAAQRSSRHIADAFGDASLSRWYESRQARLATLPA